MPALIRDFNMAALWAGLTTFVWYVFGALPLHLEVAGQLSLNAAQASTWIFIIWFTGAISSVGLSLYYRMPIPITWTIPGLIYLGTLAGQFSFAEIVGANLTRPVDQGSTATCGRSALNGDIRANEFPSIGVDRTGGPGALKLA